MVKSLAELDEALRSTPELVASFSDSSVIS